MMKEKIFSVILAEKMIIIINGLVEELNENIFMEMSHNEHLKKNLLAYYSNEIDYWKRNIPKDGD